MFIRLRMNNIGTMQKSFQILNNISKRKLSLINIPGISLNTSRSTGEQLSKPSQVISFNKNLAATIDSIGDYELGESIGSGRFGEIRKVASSPTMTDTKLAMKIVNRLEFPGVFKNESLIYKNLYQYSKKEDVSNYFSIPKHLFTEKEYLCIVFEFFEGKDLFEKLLDDGPIREDFAKVLFSHLLHGIKVLHEMKIVHRDIKPENILLRLNKK